MVLSLPLPESMPKGVRVWLLPIDLLAPVADADWDILTAEERLQAGRFFQHADCVRMVATRAALRGLLSGYLDCDPAAICLVKGEHNKLQLQQDRALAFNVSHSGAYALIALGATPELVSIGVDIEQHRANREFSCVAEYAFTPQERAFLEQCQGASEHRYGLDYEAAFFLNWVGKEAVLKAVGVGISEHLQSVAIRFLGNGGLVVDHQVADWLALHVCKLDVPAKYSAAIAWQMKEGS